MTDATDPADATDATDPTDPALPDPADLAAMDLREHVAVFEALQTQLASELEDAD